MPPDIAASSDRLPSSTSIQDLCDRHHISRTFVDNEIRTGRLRTRRIGRAIRILVTDELAWLESLPSGQEPYTAKGMRKSARCGGSRHE